MGPEEQPVDAAKVGQSSEGLRARLRHARTKAVLALRRRVPPRILRWRTLRRAPRVANVEVTTACDLACPLCPTHVVERGTRYIDEASVEGVLASASALRDVCFHVQGEPLMHPELFRIVDRFEERGVRTHFSTNGRRLGERASELAASRLSSLSVAIDGVRQEDYGRYRRGGDVAALLDGVRAVLKARGSRRTPRVQLQLILFPYLEGRIEAELRELARLGADALEVKRPSLTVDTRPFDARRSDPKVQSAIERAEQFSSELGAGDTIGRRRMGGVLHRDEPLCPQLEKATVLCDGRVVACSLDADGSTAFGNVREKSLGDIWRSQARADLLKRFQAKAIPLCRSCWLASEPKRPGRALGETGAPVPATDSERTEAAGRGG